MNIPFTQYLRPDGRKRSMNIDRPDEIAVMAQQLIDAGVSFDIEELMTGQISMTAESENLSDNKDYPVLAQEVCENDPNVLIRVDKLITDAHAIVKAKL